MSKILKSSTNESNEKRKYSHKSYYWSSQQRRSILYQIMLFIQEKVIAQWFSTIAYFLLLFFQKNIVYWIAAHFVWLLLDFSTICNKRINYLGFKSLTMGQLGQLVAPHLLIRHHCPLDLKQMLFYHIYNLGKIVRIHVSWTQHHLLLFHFKHSSNGSPWLNNVLRWYYLIVLSSIS